MKYKIDMLSFNILQEKATVNKFQRRLVWSKEEKNEFIETLKQGFPFGSILIYKYKDQDKFSIIDGLQRYSTIEDFNQNPHKYVKTMETFVDEIYKNIFQTEVTDITENNYKNHIRASINELFETQQEDYYAGLFDIMKNNMLLKEYVESKSDFIYNTQHKIKEEVKNYLNIDYIQIPCIEFIGNETELADVFQNLNRGGKKLSKYQVFSAQWSNYKTIT